MKEELTNKGTPILMPFLVGSVVGAGLALLFTPKPGKEIRKDVKRFAASAKDRVYVAIDKGKELYGDGRTAVANAVEAGKEFYDEGRKAVTNAIEAGKTAFTKEKEKWQHA